MEKGFTLSSKLIFSRNSIQNASKESEHYFFLRGPFEELSDDKFCDPYERDIDYHEEMTRTYLTIVSCGGRVSYGTGADELLPSDIYEVAKMGGWNEDTLAYQEVYGGGGDILPDYVTVALADALLDVLGQTTSDFIVEGKQVSRELLWRAIIILRSGPTLMPW